MATDTRAQKRMPRMTLAEVCEAIAAGEVSYTVADGAYQLSHRALRRLREPEREVPVELLGCPDSLASGEYSG